MALGTAGLIFVAVAWPTGVLAMLDPEYCFVHEERPATASHHEETLTFFPPGPSCRYALADGTSKTVGPGWWPGVSLGSALVMALVFLRVKR